VRPQFDAEAFYSMLLNASHAAFTTLQEFAHETIYSIELHTSAELAYFTPIVSTEEQLRRVAEGYLTRYANSGWYEGITLEQMRICLRHNLADSAYIRHKSIEHLIQEVNAVSRQLHTVLQQEFYQLLSLGLEEEALQMMSTQDQPQIDGCSECMAQLDREGVFGVGAYRERVVLNVLEGDMSDEARLARAERLNSDRILQRYRTELDQRIPIIDTMYNNMDRRRKR
jgi:hypothetical protein